MLLADVVVAALCLTPTHTEPVPTLRPPACLPFGVHRLPPAACSIRLNEVTPGLAARLAPTDCRLRPDQHYLEQGLYDQVCVWGGVEVGRKCAV